MCKHELPDLMGTADGIVCRKCGRLFSTMEEIAAENAPAQEAPAEKPKRTRKKKDGDA